MMLKIYGILLFQLTISFALHAQNTDKSIYQTIDLFYKKYISSGLVDYKLIKSNSKELDSIVKIVESYLPSSNQDKKAFLINAYNIFTIKQLTDTYPVKSPQDVNGFYDNKIFNVLGKEVATLVNDFRNPGHYEVLFDGSNLASGVYYYKID